MQRRPYGGAMASGGSDSFERWVIEDRATRQSFWSGLLLAPLVLIVLLPLGQDGLLLLFLCYVLLVAVVVGRRNRAMGWGFFRGSAVGGFLSLLVGTPLLFFGMMFEHFDEGDSVATAAGPDGLDVTYRSGHDPYPSNSAYQIANDTDEPVIIREGPDSELTITSYGTVVIGVDECHDTALTAVDTKGNPLDERPSFCPGEIWHVGPNPRTSKPGGPPLPAAAELGLLQVTYVDPDYLETSPDVFLIVNATERPVQVRDGNGWRLAKVPVDRAAVVTANDCEDLRLSAAWSNGDVFAEQPELCGGSTWFLHRSGESTMVVGGDH